MVGITSYGAYIPFHRMPRSVISKAWGRAGGRGEKAVRNFDEDSITMSVAAGIDCLKGVNPKSVDALLLATTTSPYKERQCSTIVAAALDMREEIRAADFANGLRTGVIALLSAVDAVKAGSAKRVLVTVADCRLGAPQGESELASGDGAAALMVGDEGVAVEVEESFTISEDFPDSWRSDEDIFVRSWEDRFTLDQGYWKTLPRAIEGLMRKCGLAPKEFAKVVYYGPNARRHGQTAGRLGFDPAQVQDPLLDKVGNTGAALPLLGLVAALEEAKPGDRILLASYGNGSDAIALRVTDHIGKIGDRRGVKRHLESKRALEDYPKYLRWRGLIPLEASARPPRSAISLSAQWRERKGILPLYGKKCLQCSTPQLFVDSNAAAASAHVCVICQAKDDFEDYRFADKKATIFTFTHDLLAVSEDPPNTYAVIDFEGGGRALFEMSDRNPDEVKVGMEVEMTFRKLYTHGGIHNYYWKAMPIRC